MGQKKITNRLRSLEEIDDVNLDVSSGGGTVRIEHDKHHGLNFLFKWAEDHFIGYFVDSDGNQSQAVISIYTSMQAMHFVTAYSLLFDMRANQRAW